VVEEKLKSVEESGEMRSLRVEVKLSLFLRAMVEHLTFPALRLFISLTIGPTVKFGETRDVAGRDVKADTCDEGLILGIILQSL
jgi:hypothetical protein